MKLKGLSLLLIAVFITGCGAFAQSTPAPLPTISLDSNTGNGGGTSSPAGLPAGSAGVAASGLVVAEQEAQIASALGGSIIEVAAAAGDTVSKGQVLVRLGGSEKLAAAVEAADLELLSAQQQLKALNDNANQDRAAAQLRLANAQKALDDAQKRRSWKQYRNGSQSNIETAQADLILAKDALDTAQNNYSGFEGKSETDINRAAALSALAAARKAYDHALANLNYLQGMPNPLDVDQVEAELQAAKAEVESAQKEYDRIKNGPDPDALALAEARVKNAQAQLAAGKAALADLELKAPFDGTVAKVNFHSSEWVVPGQTILVLVDLIGLKVRTTDLSERDIPHVKIGQPATIQIKALDLTINGRVSAISPLADTLGGDVVYQTTLDLDSQPEGLREGMSAEVQFEGGN